MPKKNINLLIPQEPDSPRVKKLKKILPVICAVLSGLFLISFFGILIFNNSNVATFARQKQEIDILEKKISDQKDIEGVYSLSNSDARVISKIMENKNTFINLLSEVQKLSSSDIEISTVNVNGKGDVTFTVTASNAQTLDILVNRLAEYEIQKKFSKMEAKGIVRDKLAKYLLSVTLIADKSLLK